MNVLTREEAVKIWSECSSYEEFKKEVFRHFDGEYLFVKELKKHIPTRSRLDAGVDFNLKQIHLMIDDYLENKQDSHD